MLDPKLFRWVSGEILALHNAATFSKPKEQSMSSQPLFLAHLWGAYAISLALSILLFSIVRHVSSVSTTTTRNN